MNLESNISLIKGKYRLTAIKGGKRLRTPSVEGHIPALPQKGERFVMLGNPLTLSFDELTATGVRVVSTSPVKRMLKSEDIWYFETDNSYYKLEEVKDDTPE